MTRRIDLTGQTFGRFTVVALAEPRRMPSGQAKAYWLCRCECGTERAVSSQSLRDGRSQSCGCYNSDQARARAHDHAGKRFGRLIAVGRGDTLADGTTTWVCECDCGMTAVVVRTGQLVSGDVLSCGCLRRLLSAHRRWQGAEVGYLGMHDRLRAQRGAAREHACVDCGGTARDWSYIGGDPDERREVVNGSELAYSTDPERYAPRCSPCHRRHDAAARRAVAS